MKKTWVKTLSACVFAAALYVIMYLLMTQDILSRALQTTMTQACYNVVLSVSLCLVVGFLGELSLGHAGFFAVGAYVGCLVGMSFDVPLVLQFIIGAVAAFISSMVVGALIGASILRLKGDYLAIVTLAFGEIIRSFVKIIPVTGGVAGLSGIPRFSRPEAFTVGFLMVVLTIVCVRNLVKSQHGRVTTAIRDNVIAAESVGVPVNRYRVMVFALAAGFAGLAGVMYGFFSGAMKPQDFDYNQSIEILVMVVLGGMSIIGSAVAAIILTFLPEVLREAAQYRMLLYAIALVMMMLYQSAPVFDPVRRLVDRIGTAVRGAAQGLWGRVRRLLSKKEG